MASGSTSTLSWAAAIYKATVVVALLTYSFATFTPERALGLVGIGTLVFLALAFWPLQHQRLEAWTCLSVILACGGFGVARYLGDLNFIHPWDRGHFLKVYVCAGLIAGIFVVVPYVLVRLALARRSSAK